MLLYLLSILATALSLLLVSALFSGVVLANFPAAMVAAVVIGIVNGIIKPVLFILSLPITILTLGFFSLVVNGVCFWLASLVTPGFQVHGFWAFIVGPIVLSVVSTALNNFFVNQAAKPGVNNLEG
ncbi:phage holin family protein [Nodosilinea sp. LEGE 07088]|uniref:phage holin family protein n=1 Tax=Nodosilinea sp. LEGE 07088 TaxID=2777968 RepID=UPI001882E426|nr:phage holin family protein [Nodosilinea sp. LEGE 07088]MBE9138211.1 phage holin family protein [Nodosilinea sp. LEGE 07088]